MGADEGKKTSSIEDKKQKDNKKGNETGQSEQVSSIGQRVPHQQPVSKGNP